MTEEEIFVRKELEKVYPQLLINAKKVCGNGYRFWGDDIVPVAITFFLEKPIQQQLKTIRDGKLENFITWIMNIQVKSSSSYHYNTYRRPNSKFRELFANYEYEAPEDESKAIEEAMSCIEEELQYIDPKIKNAILGLLYKETTMAKAASSLNVNDIKFKEIVNEVIIKISKKCQHCL